METGRVEAFSDGVFAIAITLLILAVGITHRVTLEELPALFADPPPDLLKAAVVP